jgi:hypothetical protein
MKQESAPDFFLNGRDFVANAPDENRQHPTESCDAALYPEGCRSVAQKWLKGFARVQKSGAAVNFLQNDCTRWFGVGNLTGKLLILRQKLRTS